MTQLVLNFQVQDNTIFKIFKYLKTSLTFNNQQHYFEVFSVLNNIQSNINFKTL